MKNLKNHISAPAALILIIAAGCEDLDSFTTADDEIYTGSIVQAEEVRKGFGKLSHMQLTLNISAVDSEPGAIRVVSKGEGGDEQVVFADARLEPITAMKFDSLSSLDFPTGRLKNYVFNARITAEESSGIDAMIIVSLMSDGTVEARILSGVDRMYGVFSLSKEKK
ncbi:MAG: hypothetical protein ABIJ56_18645 [Pseudomonadota bacterium]